jgi:hypothetical protein
MPWWGGTPGADQAAVIALDDSPSEAKKGGLLRAATEYVCYKPIKPGEELVPDKHYIRIKVDRIHVPYSRIGTEQTHACFYAYVKTFHPRHMDVTIQSVSKSEIEKKDSSNASRIVMRNREVLGCIPFRGALNFQIGLFTARSEGGDLLDPYLDVVKEMSLAAGISVVSHALHFAKPIENAINRLLGGGRALSLEIGIDDTPSPVRSGTWLLVRAAPASAAGMAVTDEGELIDKDGMPITEFPYLVVTIERPEHKTDWQRVPDIRTAQDALRAEVERQKNRDIGTMPKEVQKRVDAFRISCLQSDDLIEGDAEYIAAMQQAKYNSVYKKRQRTSATTVEPWDLGDLGIKFEGDGSLETPPFGDTELKCEHPQN